MKKIEYTPEELEAMVQYNQRAMELIDLGIKAGLIRQELKIRTGMGNKVEWLNDQRLIKAAKV